MAVKPPHRLKRQTQAFRHRPQEGVTGDCWRTCIATVLGVDRDAVPHVLAADVDGDPDVMMRDWLATHGLGLVTFYIPGDAAELVDVLGFIGMECPGVNVILSGMSPREINHSVVAADGAIVHDPAIGADGTALVGPMNNGYWQIEAITPSLADGE